MSTEALTHFGELHAALVPGLPGGEWLTALRTTGLDAFRRAGFPTRRDEDWKYTSLRPLEQERFEAAVHEPVASEPARAHELDPTWPRLVFVNGLHAPALSASNNTQCVASLAAVLRNDADAVRARINTVADPDAHRFVALNTAFLHNGAVITVPEGVELDTPLHLLFISEPGAHASIAQPRVLIELGRNARATVVEHYVGHGEQASFTNAVTEITGGPGSRLTHYKLQEEHGAAFHIAGIHARLERDSRLASHNLCLGGRIARTDIAVHLAAEGAEVSLDGLLMGRDRQHIDNHTVVDHAQPRTNSQEHYRAILDQRARGVFNGKVIVRQDAQHIDAHQASHNLLLSRGAEIDTKPELEIYADDVKCSHGATVGDLDESAVFYLRSRGLDEANARGLLTLGFARQILQRMPQRALRQYAAQATVGRLPASERLRDFI